jgi:NAD(P)-dependent dehydrogenase (short-subunit alcohol dehydrogenase family)
MLEAGYAVVAVDKNEAGLSELSAIARRGSAAPSLLTIAADLGERRALDDVLSQARSAFGQIDILVNNVALGNGVRWPDNWENPIKLWDIAYEDWRTFFHTNVDVAFEFVCACVPSMRERNWGRVVSVTTSLSNMLFSAPYGPSKAGLEAMTACLAHDLGDCGVTANILVPGGITNTEFVPDGGPYRREDMIQPEVMIDPLLWLISDDAAAFNARRIVAHYWDAALPPREAFEAAGAPIGWPAGLHPMVSPKRRD